MASARRRKQTENQTELPERIAPMLASAIADPFDSPDHLFEIKWDGTRCITLVDSDGLRMLNRRFNDIRPRYPELTRLSRLPLGTAIDGEIIVMAEGRPSFQKLQQRDHQTEPSRIEQMSKRMPVTYVVFDLLYHDGESKLDLPLKQRRYQLGEVVGQLHDVHIVVSEGVEQHGRDFFTAVTDQGLEGMMAKRVDSPYLPGKRSDHWVKVKVAQTKAFDVIGLTLRGDTTIVSALVVGEPEPGGRWVYRGNVGTGFTESDRKAIGAQLVQCPPLDNPPADGPKDAHWRATNLRCNVRFFEYTEGGRLRGPVFKGFVE